MLEMQSMDYTQARKSSDSSGTSYLQGRHVEVTGCMFADYFMPDFGTEMLVFSDDSGSMHELKAKHNPEGPKLTFLGYMPPGQ